MAGGMLFEAIERKWSQAHLFIKIKLYEKDALIDNGRNSLLYLKIKVTNH